MEKTKSSNASRLSALLTKCPKRAPWPGGGATGAAENRLGSSPDFLRIAVQVSTSPLFPRRRRYPLLISRHGCLTPRWRRSLAQLVEHRSPKPRVVGSSPPTPASSFKQLATRTAGTIGSDGLLWLGANPLAAAPFNACLLVPSNGDFWTNQVCRVLSSFRVFNLDKLHKMADPARAIAFAAINSCKALLILGRVAPKAAARSVWLSQARFAARRAGWRHGPFG